MNRNTTDLSVATGLVTAEAFVRSQSLNVSPPSDNPPMRRKSRREPRKFGSSKLSINQPSEGSRCWPVLPDLVAGFRRESVSDRHQLIGCRPARPRGRTELSPFLGSRSEAE